MHRKLLQDIIQLEKEHSTERKLKILQSAAVAKWSSHSLLNRMVVGLNPAAVRDQNLLYPTNSIEIHTSIKLLFAISPERPDLFIVCQHFQILPSFAQ